MCETERQMKRVENWSGWTIGSSQRRSAKKSPHLESYDPFFLRYFSPNTEKGKKRRLHQSLSSTWTERPTTVWRGGRRCTTKLFLQGQTWGVLLLSELKLAFHNYKMENYLHFTSFVIDPMLCTATLICHVTESFPSSHSREFPSFAAVDDAQDMKMEAAANVGQLWQTSQGCHEIYIAV